MRLRRQRLLGDAAVGDGPTGVVMLGVVGSIEMLRYSGSALTFFATAHHGAGAR